MFSYSEMVSWELAADTFEILCFIIFEVNTSVTKRFYQHLVKFNLKYPF